MTKPLSEEIMTFSQTRITFLEKRMNKYLLSLALGALLLSFNIADAKSPVTPTTTPIQEKIKVGKPEVPNLHSASCNTAMEDLQRQADNLPATAAGIVECVLDGQNLDYCDTRLDSFKAYYGYMRDAAARKKRHCIE